nr:ATP-binding protein [Pseudoduganella ginsengisoli]
MTLAFSGLTVVLTVALAEAIGAAAGDELKAGISQGLTELALQTADKLDRGMAERYREVQLMSRNQVLITEHGPLDKRRAILNDRQATYHWYAWIGLAGLDGKVLLSTQGMLEGADVSQRPWFRNALAGIYVGDVHEAVLLAKLLPSAGNEPKRFVDIAFPFVDADGKPAGVVGAHLSWQWAKEVQQSVMQFSQTASGAAPGQRNKEALIVGMDGTVLLGPAGLQGSKLALASVTAAQAGRTGHMEERWPDGKHYLVGYSKTRGYNAYPGLGWSIVVRESLEDAYVPVHAIQRRVLWTGAALAALFSVAGLLLARLLARPMGELAASAGRVQRGEALVVEAGRRGYAEVTQLAGALNALVGNLLGKTEELNELNRSLEQRVGERTQELLRALARVRAEERRVQTIIDSAQDAFIGLDLQGRITDWNRAAEHLFGWKRDEAVGQPVDTLLIPARFREQYAKAMRSFHERGDADLLNRRLERIVVNRAGDEVPVEVTIGLAGSQDQYFFSVFLRDISERKKVEQMKNEFISTVSHELRTPMTSIRASLSMLASGMAGDLPDDTRQLIDIAYASCERMVRLVNDVLDIEKMESGKMDFDFAPRALLPLVQEAIDGVQGSAAQAHVTLVLEHGADAGLAWALADHDRIIQVLVNLLSNAVKFSPPGGQVTVWVERCHEADGDWSVIRVADQGPGIPEAFHARIFEKFAQADSTDTRQKGGTGLGLSICKAIVERHGGDISFTTQAGHGTQFSVRLKAVGSAAAAPDLAQDPVPEL